jgi:hypothetical protein
MKSVAELKAEAEREKEVPASGVVPFLEVAETLLKKGWNSAEVWRWLKDQGAAVSSLSNFKSGISRAKRQGRIAL